MHFLKSSILTILPLLSFCQKEYFDFWVDAKWENVYSIHGSDTLTNEASYDVQSSKSGTIEAWRHFEGTQIIEAEITRVYDQIDSSWYMIYKDKNFATVWSSEIEDGIPKFLKKFNLKSRSYISRQFWVREGKDQVWHIIEKSDDGKNWRPMFQSLLKRSG